MDIQSLLHNFPLNLLLAAAVGAFLTWVLCRWSSRRALRAQREEADRQLKKLRLNLLGEIDARSDDITQLEHRLAEANHLTQSLSQKANLLANEQQRYADLKDRYLNDVGRARDLLKTRGDASAELERQKEEATARYQELHQRWDSERKRYARLVTEKNQQIAELESRVEGMQLPDPQTQDASLHSYSHGQLEAMLVELRQQVSDKEVELQNLRGQSPALKSATAADDTEFQQLRQQLKNSNAKIDSKNREISRLRSQLLQDSVAPIPTGSVQLLDTSEDGAEHQALRSELNAKNTELEHLKLEIDRLKPTVMRLRRLEAQMQQALRGDTSEEPRLKSLELELEQLQSLLSRQHAGHRLSMEKQATSFQQQLNAKTDTIGRLNRQLQASRES